VATLIIHRMLENGKQMADENKRQRCEMSTCGCERWLHKPYIWICRQILCNFSV